MTWAVSKMGSASTRSAVSGAWSLIEIPQCKTFPSCFSRTMRSYEASHSESSSQASFHTCSCCSAKASTPRFLSDRSVAAARCRAGNTSARGVLAAPGHCSFKGGTLVATTARPPRISDCSDRPTSCSLCPVPYANAVSKNVMPCATASRSASRPSLSAAPRHISPPSPQQPKPSSLTTYPVVPSVRVFTLARSTTRGGLEAEGAVQPPDQRQQPLEVLLEQLREPGAGDLTIAQRAAGDERLEL